MRPIFVNLGATEEKPFYVNLNHIVAVYESKTEGGKITFDSEAPYSSPQIVKVKEIMERISAALEANK